MAKRKRSEVRLTIPGVPVVLKNSRRIVTNKYTGKKILKLSKRAEVYKEVAVLLLRTTWAWRPITGPVNLAIVSFGPWKRASDNIPDASNLYQMPEDCLEAAGVIANDRQVESHDGSRRVCMCDACFERSLYKSGPKKDACKPDCGAVKKCPFPRVEIVIETL